MKIFTPLQYSCLENPMGRGAWKAAVHGVAKSWIRLSDFTFTFHFHALEKEMETHSSVLAWRIPGKGEPGGLPSMVSQRVRHDWSDLAAAWRPYFQIRSYSQVLGLRSSQSLSEVHNATHNKSENFIAGMIHLWEAEKWLYIIFPIIVEGCNNCSVFQNVCYRMFIWILRKELCSHLNLGVAG